MRITLVLILSGLTCLLFSRCTRKEVASAEKAMRLVSAQSIEDDLELGPLLEAIKQQLSSENFQTPLQFGNTIVSRENYHSALQRLLDFAKTNQKPSVLRYIENNFAFYEVYGWKKWGEILLTSYYEPVISASRSQSDTHSMALYSLPNDLIQIDVQKYDERFKEIRRMRGRLTQTEDGRSVIVPYFSREEIEQGALKRRNLELAWVDPIDGFFLQTQGSGSLQFSDGSELALGFADQNGHVYEAIGRLLLDIIPLEQMNRQRIETHLRSLDEPARTQLLNQNPSYVFFKKLAGRPLTTYQTEVIDGRTIAADERVFPKGAIAYLKFNRPIFDPGEASEPKSWQATSRLVIDHDTGGAIRGTDQVDLFWGRGKQAEQSAIHMRQPDAKLYYLAPKHLISQ